MAGAARLALWFGIVALAMVFLALIVSFIVIRSSNVQWPPEGVRLNVPMGAVNTAVILASSWALLGAHRRSRRGDLERARFFLLLGGILALSFLGLQALQYYWLLANFGETIRTSHFGTFFYSLTGLHGIHLLVGVLWLLALLVGSGARSPLKLELCGMYWHFVSILWVIIFAILYLI